MFKYFYKVKQNKLLFSLFIVLMVLLCLDLCLILFDFIQLLIVSRSAVNLASCFLVFNVFGIILNFLGLIYFIICHILYKNSTNSKQK